MAVKKKYKLPFTLDTSQLDIELDLSPQNSNLSFSKRPITVKLFLFIAISIVLWMMLTFQTGIRHGSIVSILLWSVSYFWLVFMILSPTKTQMLGYSWVKPSLQYFFGVNRHVNTKGIDASEPLEALMDVKSVSGDGLIEFYDGDVGLIYGIVGFGSVLMFDSDRDIVIDDTSKFNRNLPLGVKLIYDTRQAPQKIEAQKAHLRNQARNLQSKSKGLKELQRKEMYFMKNYVGKAFKSTHQIMVVRALDEEHLASFKEHLNTFAGGSFLRSVEVYEQEDVLLYLKDLKG